VRRARAVSLLLALALTAPAAPEGTAPGDVAGDARLGKVQERRAALERELQRLRGEERSLLGEVERLELEERLRGEELREIEIGLQRTQARMDATLLRVRELEASLAAARPVLASRARALYKLGELSYLRLLLSVDRTADLFRGYRFVTTLARRDNERVSAFRADLEALGAERAELERRTEQSIALRAQLVAARRSLEAQHRRKLALLTSIVEKKETHLAYVAELEQAEGKLRQLLLGLIEGEVTVPVGALRGSLPWPVSGRIRSGFGRRKHPRFDTYTVHNGIEIEAAADSPVQAVHDGTVAFADRFRGYGLMVVLDHGSRHHTLYAQLGELSARVGQTLRAGETLGAVAAGPEAPRLYFEVRFQGRPEDPLEWLQAWNAAAQGP
jgi:septal ring factor EnvC (AmiA/AmiB activator)